MKSFDSNHNLDPELVDGLSELYSEAESLFYENNNPLENLKQIESPYSAKIYLNEGGMKKIYTREDLRSDRIIAYAEINNPDDPEKLNDFLREAKITAYLQHPNIIPVYEIGLNENKTPYFTMKLIKGENLAQIIKNIKLKDSKTISEFPLPRLIDIFEKVCEAIAYAHSKGILHLDIKPENISVSEYGEVLVCDWGISEPCPEALNPDTSTKEFIKLLPFMKDDKIIRGTPAFMAPEQINHELADKSPQTDIYSLGVLLYSFLTNDIPFRHTKQKDELIAVLKGGFEAPSKKLPKADIPKSLEAICLKSMQYSPDDRYNDVEDIIKDIHRYKHGYATEAEDASALELLSLLYKRNKHSCIVIISALIAIILTIAYSVSNIRKSEKLAIQERNKAVEARNKTLEAINNLKSEQVEKLKMASKAAQRYLQNLKNALYFKNYKKADETAKTIWELGAHDKEIQLYYGWYLVALQEFDQARKILKKLPSQTKYLEVLKIAEMTLSYETTKEISRIIAKDLNERNLAGYFLRNALNKGFTIKEQMMILKQELATNTLKPIKFKYELLPTGIKLDISKTQITYPGSLDKFKIIDLDISNTSISRNDIINWQIIERLNLEGAKIKSLIAAPNLKWLNIADSALLDFNKLKYCPKLEYLDIRGMMKFPQEILRRLKSLKTLVINKNQKISIKGKFEVLIK